MRNISSTFNWTDPNSSADDSDTSPKKAQYRMNDLLKEAKVVKLKVNILNDKQPDISKPCPSIKSNNNNKTSQNIGTKL